MSRRVLRAATVLATTPLVWAAVAGAAGAATVQEFALPAGATTPRDIAAGPNGALWITSDGALIELRPNGQASRRTTGITPGRQPYAIAPGPGGTLWFTEDDEETETGEGDGVIGRVSATGAIDELDGDGLESPAGLRDVAAGPNGTAAYVGGGSGALGILSEDVDEDDDPVVRYDSTSIDAGNQDPGSIAAGPDGRYWYTGLDSPNAIGAVTFGPRRDDYAATFEQYDLPTTGRLSESQPDDIVAGPDGGMWFTLPYAGAIGRIDVATHAITSYAVSPTSLPTGITLGPDGAIWFTDAGPVPGVGRLDPVTKQIVVRTDGFSSPAAAPQRITTGPDGALWLTEPGVHLVGRVDPVAFLVGPPPPDPGGDPDDPGTTTPTTPTPPPPVAAPPIVDPPAPSRTPTVPASPERGRAAVFSRFSYGVRVRAPRRPRLSFRLSRPATVRVTIAGAPTRTVASVTRSGGRFRARAGLNRVILPRLAPGLHVVRLRATTADGRTSTLRARVRVLPARTAAPNFTG